MQNSKLKDKIAYLEAMGQHREKNIERRHKLKFQYSDTKLGEFELALEKLNLEDSHELKINEELKKPMRNLLQILRKEKYVRSGYYEDTIAKKEGKEIKYKHYYIRSKAEFGNMTIVLEFDWRNNLGEC